MSAETTQSGLDFREHTVNGSISLSAVAQSKYSWPFRVSNYITWSGVSVCRVTQTTSSCPSKSLHTVTSKNRSWPFLKKTLSNNFADKSHSTPTLGQCEWYVCVNLFLLPWSIFAYYEPVALLHIQFLFKIIIIIIQMKRITVGMDTHCFLLPLMFCFCNINCCYIFMWKLLKKALSPSLRFAVAMWVLISI